MARIRLTVDGARVMQFSALVETCQALLAQYEAPDIETPDELDRRISRTLDELPDVYGWLQAARSHFDHWTDFNADTHGLKSLEYKGMRQRRDLMEHMASSAKLRYEGTSRRLTQIQGAQEEAAMPRGRR